MRHRRSKQAINGKPDRARMMARNLVTSLLLYESIRTTRNRARAVQPVIDRLISSAKRMDARNAIRAINSFVTDKNACKKIMEVYVERYKDRPSGFTRIVAAGARKGDGAELVDLSFVDGALSSSASAQ